MAKIKERKGKYLKFSTKKNFSTKIWPSIRPEGYCQLDFPISLVKPCHMKWQEFVKDYLTFTRKERIGIIVILVLILVIIFLPQVVLKRTSPKSSPIDTAWAVALKKIEKNQPETSEPQSSQGDDENAGYQYDRIKNNFQEQTKRELFYFDPNTISTVDWKKLGLRDKTIQTIQNYLNKGGHFKKPEDLQKIYGLRQDEYERLAPFVQIQNLTGSKNTETTAFSKTQNESQTTKTFAPRYSIIDINVADTTGFIALPGIGSKLAARIVNFREKLGGFYSIEQVGETFGLPDSTFQKIKQYLKLENISLRKMNINTTTVDELKAHPYIKWSIANPIVSYRNEHGLFSKLEEIKKVVAVTDEIYNKIVPYLVIQ